jgi:tetratricopeptide (TPR) repeat protein
VAQPVSTPIHRRLLIVAVWLSLLALGASLGLQKIRTFDYWWQLRTGALILETGEVPKQDVYTYTVPGARYIDIHWLHQLGLHGLHSLGGHDAVVVAKALAVCALIAILAPIGYRRERPWVSALALGLMLLVAADRFMPRPELPSFLLLAAVLALLDRHERRRDAWVFAIVPLQLLWANVHGLFALGLALCAIYLVAEVLRPLVAPDQGLDTRAAGRLAAVTALGSLVCLLNPNGLDGALYPIQQFGMIGPPEDRGVFGSLIAELIPPIGGGREHTRPALALTGVLAILSLLAMAWNWRRVHAADPLLWVAFAYLALGANRNLALFSIVAAPILARNANAVLDRRSIPRHAGTAASAAAVVVLALLTLDVARDRFFQRLASFREAGLGTMEIYYPVGAAEWIAEVRPPGPICHHMADGGYLIWRLFPDYKSMVDGRLEVFGAERFIQLQVAEPGRFKELDAEYRFGVVLVHFGLVKSDALLWWLHLNSNWLLAYLDDTTAVYVHRDRSGLPWIRELDIDAPELFPPLDRPNGVSDLVRRFGRTQFYMAMRRFEPALEFWEDTIARYPDLPQGPIVHASLLQSNGLHAAAEAILRRLLEERPGDAKLLVQVGDLRWEAGDREVAKGFYDRALEANPDFAYANFRRGMAAEVEGDLEMATRLYGRVLALTHPGDPVALLASGRLGAISGTF